MENRLRAIVTRIEASKLSEDDKAALYATISEGLQSTVWPVLLTFMPKNQLEDLAKNPSKVTIESYASLIERAVKDGEALKEIEDLMIKILTEVDVALKEEQI